MRQSLREEALMRRSLLGLLTGIILAGFNTSFAGGWGVQTTITGYYVYDNGGAYITTANNENADNCASTGYLYVDETSAHFKEIWATIMTAQATGSTVTLRYDGCGGASYPKVTAVVVPHIW
jgi:hypothetical protein